MNSARILLTLSLLIFTLEAHGAQQEDQSTSKTGEFANVYSAIASIIEHPGYSNDKRFECPICNAHKINQSRMCRHLHSNVHFDTQKICETCKKLVCYGTWLDRHSNGKCKKRKNRQ